MDLTGLWSFIIVLSIFCGLFVGSWVKRKSQMIIPLNDPVSLLLILGFFGILVMPDLVPEYAYIDPYDMNQLACVVGFLIAYLYGYWKGELLCVFVSAHDIWKLRQEIRPIAYYYNSRGDLCWQPQRMTYVLKRMVFNVDCPLDYDVGSIARRREVVFQGKYIKMSAHVVDTAKMEIRTEYVRGRLLRHKVLRCHFDPSPLNTYDEYDFYINGSIADEYVRNYQRLKIDNMNAAAGMQMAEMIGAVDMIGVLNRMTPDSLVFGEIMRDLKARNVSSEDIEEREEAVSEDRTELGTLKRKHSEAQRKQEGAEQPGGGYDA